MAPQIIAVADADAGTPQTFSMQTRAERTCVVVIWHTRHASVAGGRHWPLFHGGFHQHSHDSMQQQKPGRHTGLAGKGAVSSVRRPIQSSKSPSSASRVVVVWACDPPRYLGQGP